MALQPISGLGLLFMRMLIQLQRTVSLPINPFPSYYISDFLEINDVYGDIINIKHVYLMEPCNFYLRHSLGDHLHLVPKFAIRVKINFSCSLGLKFAT
jgi:hypothetical protein